MSKHRTYPLGRDLHDDLVAYQIAYFTQYNIRSWNRPRTLLAIAKTLAEFNLTWCSSGARATLFEEIFYHRNNGGHERYVIPGEQLDLLRRCISRQVAMIRHQ